MTRIVHRALDLAGLKDMRREFECLTGDGLAFGFAPSQIPFVISPLADVLNSLLHRHNAEGGTQMRLRMCIHVGPVPHTPGLPGDGNAAPRSETQRLLDSVPVRSVLTHADARATPLVLIISETVYRTVVVGGYCALPPARFTEVRAEVTGKNFTQNAWIYVPSPSGKLLASSAVSRSPLANAPAEADDPASGDSRSSAARHQHVRFGVAVVDCTMRDLHHHTGHLPGPDRR
ncbi:hypothetical protein [Streptomyces sp. NPDC058305]|uniref:hypothetical protein n=1 Tax=Streptomyces sp. NPDC058305 TaxID=3346438 RepID=UPI0036E7E74C